MGADIIIATIVEIVIDMIVDTIRIITAVLTGVQALVSVLECGRYASMMPERLISLFHHNRVLD